MSSIVDGLLYTRDHEWARVNGNTVTVGITDYAQDQLGDVVFVELPPVGKELKQDGNFGVVESVKAVSDLYSPVNGKVTKVNPGLKEKPEVVNSDPYGEGWMIEVEVADTAQLQSLLDASAYRQLIGE